MFQKVITAAAITVSILATSPAGAQVRRAAHPVDGQYIVVLKGGIVRPADADLSDRRPSIDEIGSTMADRHHGRAMRSFGSALQGFAFHGDAAAAAALAADPSVAYVAEDGWVQVASQQTPTPSWGLDRIDQRPGALDTVYDYDADGRNVDVYVIDTGIRSTHVDFGGRVDLGRSFSAIDDGHGTEDCNGHGTHVAGIIGSATYGVAKGVTLHPVRVLDCSGWGQISGIVAGIDWVTSLYATAPAPPGHGKKAPQGGGGAAATGAVVNMSIATLWSSAIDDAVTSSIAAGITYVVAAGNDGANACSYSPARVPGAITVGASDGSDTVASFSNTGSCVDLFAPGSSIVSTFLRNDTDSLAMTGTSMAAPHVTGTVALLLSINPKESPADVATIVRAAATSGRLTNAASGTANLLLFAPFTGWNVDMAPVAQFKYLCSSGTCSFDATSSADDRGILAYGWDLGNGHTGSGATQSVRYARNGPTVVTVILTITDNSGQTRSSQQLVQVTN
jgi:serine protease